LDITIGIDSRRGRYQHVRGGQDFGLDQAMSKKAKDEAIGRIEEGKKLKDCRICHRVLLIWHTLYVCPHCDLVEIEDDG
jgi:Zn finger protein HypA/HybF involved in hydrogenase expression